MNLAWFAALVAVVVCLAITVVSAGDNDDDDAQKTMMMKKNIQVLKDGASQKELQNLGYELMQQQNAPQTINLMEDFAKPQHTTTPASASAAAAAETILHVVEFDDDPVLITFANHPHGIDRRSRHVVDYMRLLEEKHQRMLASEEGVQIAFSLGYTVSAAAAWMTQAKASELRSRPGVVGVYKSERWHVQTDGTPKQLGLATQHQQQQAPEASAWRQGYTGEDVVIGIIDTGIWPEHASFADAPTPEFGDTGDFIPYGPPPFTFSGTGCAFGDDVFNSADSPFACNNKLLAAKCYNMGEGFSSGPGTSLCGGDGAFVDSVDFNSAREFDMHGSHVASIAAGNAGVPAVIDGEAVGTVTGMAPRARLSIYKVCFRSTSQEVFCSSTDTLKALDDAVMDGVDVINMSIGGPTFPPYAVALLNAMESGVVVSCAAGYIESGRGVSFPAALPWVAAVASTRTEESLVAKLTIVAPGHDFDGTTVVGTPGAGGVDFSENDDDIKDLFSGVLVPAEPLDACGGVATTFVPGQIALVDGGSCTFADKFNNVATKGAKVILVAVEGDNVKMYVPGTTIPGLSFSTRPLSVENILTSNDEVRINAVWFSGVERSSLSPQGPFDLRGLNSFPSKPDIAAPGENILAATGPITEGNSFSFLSGTSMASPHLAGVFALLKQAHPDWSGFAIKSAVMTTADSKALLDPQFLFARPFGVGSGMVQPDQGLSPGLVYNNTLEDYWGYLCGTPDGDDLLPAGTCDSLAAAGVSFQPEDVNYPSISKSDIDAGGSYTFVRTLTNVAGETITLVPIVDAPPGYTVAVVPSELTLDHGDSVQFELAVSAQTTWVHSELWSFGSLTWITKDVGDMDGQAARGLAESEFRTTNLRRGHVASPPSPQAHLLFRGVSRQSAGTEPSAAPSTSSLPSDSASSSDSSFPSTIPHSIPSSYPSVSDEPSGSPSPSSSGLPSLSTNPSLSSLPSVDSTVPSITTFPSATPSLHPIPSSPPSSIPSHHPSASPTSTTSPSVKPTVPPSAGPTHSSSPSSLPSVEPTRSASPSISPSAGPSNAPSLNPSALPSVSPSAEPSTKPSMEPSASPSARPTHSLNPSSSPSAEPTGSSKPSASPSASPSSVPSSLPSENSLPSFVLKSPIAVSQGPPFQSIPEAQGSGTSGQLTFDVVLRYPYKPDRISFYGLAKPVVYQGFLFDTFAIYDRFVFWTSSELIYFRNTLFDAFTLNPSDDLAIFMELSLNGGNSFQQLGITNTPGTSNEDSRIRFNPNAGIPVAWRVSPFAVSLDGPYTSYLLFTTIIERDGGQSEGNVRIEYPDNPTAGKNTVTVSWSGLDSGTFYSGVIRFLAEDGSVVGNTEIFINTF